MSTESATLDTNVTASNGPPGPLDEQGWRSQVRGQGLAVGWLVCTVVGAIAIHFSGSNPARRLGIPVAIMLFYAIYGYARAQDAPTQVLKTARIGQIADSLYFLGFIWTLWALIDSFVFQQMTAAEAVFRTFGYALVTTASGMFLRLLLLLFRYWGADQAEVGERQLENEIEKFSAAVARSIDAARGLEKAVQGIQAQASEYLEAVSGTAQASINKLAAFTTTSLQPSMDELAHAVRAYAQDVKAAGAELKDASSGMATSVRTAAADMAGAVGLARSSVLSETKKAVDEMERALQETQRQTAKHTEEVADMVRASLERIAVFNNASFKPALDEVVLNIRNYAKDARVAGAQIREASEEMIAGVRTSTVKMGDAVELSHKSVDNARKAIDGVDESIRSAARKIDGIRVLPSLVEDSVRARVTGILSDLERTARVMGVSAEKLAELNDPQAGVAGRRKGIFTRLRRWLFGD